MNLTVAVPPKYDQIISRRAPVIPGSRCDYVVEPVAVDIAKRRHREAKPASGILARQLEAGRAVEARKGDDGRVNLSGINGTNGFELDGSAAQDYRGHAVSSAGDFNGDGFDDLIVGAFGADLNGALSGASYVVFGHAGTFAAAIALSSLNGTKGFKIPGVAAGDLNGYAVASAGDVNGDGKADILFRNNSNGALDYDTINGNGMSTTFHAIGPSGTAYAVAGDFNGDGLADILFRNNSSDALGYDTINGNGTSTTFHPIGTPGPNTYTVHS